MQYVRDSSKNLQLLSRLLLSTAATTDAASVPSFTRESHSDLFECALSLTTRDIDSLKSLANTNHVVMRAFAPLQQIVEAKGNHEAAKMIAATRDEETRRIGHALDFLTRICSTLEGAGCNVTVIKSLDHWPDLGSDLDLFTDADPARVVQVMTKQLQANVEDRSWGDRLANKWNFAIPGLPELVEIHIGRLGQTGEQTAVTCSVSTRGQTMEINGHSFRVPAPEDRIVISTLQRMYRHFYIRLCDVVDNARLLDLGLVDFDYLHSLGETAGLWKGIATYLSIISEYVKSYRGEGVLLPELVTGSAKFGTEQVRFRKDFLRVSIMPHSMNLYAAELKTLLLKGDLRNTLRLSLLPGLATAAALEQKLTGSDKGIW
jgi:hypothetical protein